MTTNTIDIASMTPDRLWRRQAALVSLAGRTADPAEKERLYAEGRQCALAANGQTWWAPGGAARFQEMVDEVEAKRGDA